MWPSQPLLDSDVFKAAREIPGSQPAHLALAENAYLRAEAISKIYDLKLNDIMELSPKFWKLHMDPITWHDGASTTIFTIHYNLAVGTIASYAKDRPDLLTIIDDLVNFNAIGQFCLTEVGHGLDAANLRTTATLLNDGSFDLHTPDAQAAKYMPPTVPVLGRPCFAVVWAQLVIDRNKRGVRPFVVKLNDGVHMSKGITAK